MKKCFILLLVCIAFISCKDEDDNSNIDIYSSQNMRGTYLFCLDCDNENFDYSVLWRAMNVRNISKDGFVFYTIHGSYFYDFKMHKEGNIFYEKDKALYGSLFNPYRVKGVINYIPEGNPLFPYPYYELRGAYFTDTTFTDTVGTFWMKQISYDTNPYHNTIIIL